MPVALFVDVPANLGYALVYLLVAGETAGALLPGETALILAGALAGQGKLSLPIVVGVGAAGAITGDNIGYLIGARGLRLLLRRFGPGLVRRGEVFFERHGPKAVFLARWLPGLRLVGAWFAGASRMPWPQFLFWNALGGVAWAASVAVSADLIGHAAGGLLGALGAAIGAVIVLAFATRRLRR